MATREPEFAATIWTDAIPLHRTSTRSLAPIRAVRDCVRFTRQVAAQSRLSEPERPAS
jgi:hypothetical protein